MKKNIYYDATFSVGNFRGMGKYINNFVRVLNSSNNLTYLGLLPKSKLYYEGRFHSFGFRNYLLWEQISLLFFSFKKNTNSVFIFPYNTAPLFLNSNNKNVLVIHDLIFMGSYKSSSLRQLFGNLYRKLVLPIVIRKFNNIVTVSEYSKRQIVDYFNVPDSSITVIPNCIEFDQNQLKDNIKFNDRLPYFFHIGGEPDHKNTLVLIEAFSRLPISIQDIYSLKIVGIRESYTLKKFKKVIEDLKLCDKVELLSNISDEKIEFLYKNAKLFVLPSKEEGFGIPIIESMKFGCPLICSNSSCLPEIAGNSSLYFSPDSSMELAGKIIELLENEIETEERILNGYEILNYFSYDNFKNKVTKLLENILSF